MAAANGTEAHRADWEKNKNAEIRLQPTVATDGHRLVRVIYTNITQAKPHKDIVVPAKALMLVSKAVEGGSNTLSVNLTHIKFSFKNFTLTSRLIEENYPNYESVIPLDNDKKLSVNRNTLLASVRRVLFIRAIQHIKSAFL